MTLQTGTQLGPYTIAAPLGAGGMGEVYRARDTRLDRDVAIKVLPETFARDPERVARFQREAKVLASLNHPHIAAIYGFEEADGNKFLVLEYVAGETLASRLQRGALPVDETLDLAKRIAEAMEAAHEKGVIHRDLKPGNVMITRDGAVKVLDFGLAKALADDSATSVPADSPTLTANYTRPGVILGTAAYMSPEQARGRPVDKRTDVWSFGVILFECLSGKPLFAGENATDSLGAILHKDPDWTLLPARTPATLRWLLRRCLAKDRKLRLHDIADARLEIETALVDPQGLGPNVSLAGHRRRSRAPGAFSVALVMVTAVVASLAAWNLKPLPEPRRTLRKLEIHVDGLRRDEGYAPVISPDGQRLAFIANGSLWVRALHELDAVELSGTKGVSHPFWSPDSAQIGYHDGSRLWRVAAGGGSRSMICVTPRKLEAVGGAAWMPDGRVVFTAAWGGPFWEAPVGGGEARKILTPDVKVVQDFHCANAFPDGSGVLSVQHRTNGDVDGIVLVRGGSFDLLLEHPHEELRSPVYSNGHILYGRVQSTSTIWAAPFSLSSHKVTGPSFLIAESADLPSASLDGTLVYAASTWVGTGQFIWVDRAGAVVQEIAQPQAGLSTPVLSPDQLWSVAFATETGTNQIWLHDLARGTRRPLTSDKGTKTLTGWLSDGRVTFSGPEETFAVSVTGSSAPESLFHDTCSLVSPDGRFAVHDRLVEDSFDLVYIRLAEGAAVRALANLRATETEPAVRSDGHWLAYVSDETGREEVFVIRLPSGDGKLQVSVDGGVTPRWSPKGDELFFQTARNDEGDVMVVQVQTDPKLRLSAPQRLFSGAATILNLERGWDVSSDAQRFLGIRDVTSRFEVSRITVVENWDREFKKP